MINKKMKIFLKNKIEQKFKEIYTGDDFMCTLNINEKSDRSVVTHIDLFISDLVKDYIKQHNEYLGLNFYSEEDRECFDFPTLVLDPIDGTKALLTGVPECCVSLAILQEDDTKSEGWLYNPFNGFEISSDDIFVAPIGHSEEKQYVGMVSRSDYKKGIFDNSRNEKTLLYPKGSIAYKLGLLAAGACDFVFSMTPKNIWDIAAGTVILNKRGYRLYQKGEEVLDLNKVHLDGDLLWCLPEYEKIIRQDLI